MVHSICHSYNGAANKNVGDAFLLSWSLDDGPSRSKSPKSTGVDGGDTKLRAKSNQADKALLSVIKICISLQYDKFYLEPLSDGATMRLKSKLKNRPGPVVQMGFGLHAGKAVQGAIGSQRKIDATYVSEAVERAEFLEASTKKYGLNMLMSGNFHKVSYTFLGILRGPWYFFSFISCPLTIIRFSMICVQQSSSTRIHAVDVE